MTWEPKPASGRPAEPYQPGNTEALKHGAFSERKVAPLAEHARAELLDRAPWVSSPTFAASVAAWTRCEARIVLVSRYLDEHGLLDDAGKPRAAAELYVRLERLAIDLRSRLGLDPTSAVKITAALAAASRESDLEELIRKGAAIRERRERGLGADEEEDHA